MAEWKSLEVLICEYIEGQRRLDEAIARNRAKAGMEPNRRKRLDLDRQCEDLRTMRGELAYSIVLMRRYLDGK
ncbi:MAG: hypothetical protein ACLUDG_02900 [Butyricicoccus sp.]|nr:hypothetical protein [Butyricicoccus pullicaecorum]